MALLFTNGENSSPLLAQALIPDTELPKRVRVIVSTRLAIGTLQVYIAPSGGSNTVGSAAHYVYFTGTSETRELDLGVHTVDLGYSLRVEVSPLAGTSGEFYVTIVTEAP